MWRFNLFCTCGTMWIHFYVQNTRFWPKVSQLLLNGLLCSLPSRATNTYRGWDSTKERTVTWTTAPEPKATKGTSSLLHFLDQTLLDEDAIESLLFWLPLETGRMVIYPFAVFFTSYNQSADIGMLWAKPSACIWVSLCGKWPQFLSISLSCK